MMISMRYILVTLLFNYVINSSINYHENNLLFCLDKNEPVIDFSISNRADSENKKQLVNFFKSVDNNYSIKPWLTAATDEDSSGDIFLNRIYKISFDNINPNNLNQIKNQLGDVPKTYADITKAKKDLNYEPKTSLIDGLTNTYNYLKKL